MSAPELRHFRSFVGVADAGTVSRAAQRLHMSQPALSRQIADLERELGVRLFDRVGRRLALTRHGEELLARGRRLLSEMDAIQERAQSLAGGAAGVLRIGATAQVIETALSHVLPRYRRLYPNVDVQVMEDGGKGLIARVRDGDAHIVIVALRGAEGFASRALFPARLVAVMAHGHRLARARSLSVADLGNEPILTLPPGLQSRGMLDEAAAAAGINLRIAFESRTPHSLLALASAGHGVGILWSSMLGMAAPTLHVAGLVRDGRPLGSWSGAVWDPRRHMPPHAEIFLDMLARQTATKYPGYRVKVTREVPRPR
jgi:DNA-binding transcriptional LysR family regulator